MKSFLLDKDTIKNNFSEIIQYLKDLKFSILKVIIEKFRTFLKTVSLGFNKMITSIYFHLLVQI